MARHRFDRNVEDTEIAPTGGRTGEPDWRRTMNHPEIARLMVDEHINDLYREAEAARLAAMTRAPGRSVMTRLASALTAARQAVAPKNPLPGQSRTASRS
jgi:hypothetical protein